jgi:hypothetical protein
VRAAVVGLERAAAARNKALDAWGRPLQDAESSDRSDSSSYMANTCMSLTTVCRSTSGLGKGDGINNHTDKWLQASNTVARLGQAAAAAAAAAGEAGAQRQTYSTLCTCAASANDESGFGFRKALLPQQRLVLKPQPLHPPAMRSFTSTAVGACTLCLLHASWPVCQPTSAVLAARQHVVSFKEMTHTLAPTAPECASASGSSLSNKHQQIRGLQNALQQQFTTAAAAAAVGATENCRICVGHTKQTLQQCNTHCCCCSCVSPHVTAVGSKAHMPFLSSAQLAGYQPALMSFNCRATASPLWSTSSQLSPSRSMAQWWLHTAVSGSFGPAVPRQYSLSVSPSIAYVLLSAACEA